MFNLDSKTVGDRSQIANVDENTFELEPAGNCFPILLFFLLQDLRYTQTLMAFESPKRDSMDNIHLSAILSLYQKKQQS